MLHYPVVIIGAGPAGLTAAYELVKRNIHPIVLEQADKVGGLSCTEVYKGYRFDIGGHRFYTKVEGVQQLWQEMLGEDFLRVSRLSRIHYRGRFFNYPLEFRNALTKLGIAESLLILSSYLKARVQLNPPEDTFEHWVTNRFGQRLYRTFFKTYTEKVWGIPGHEIQADWAAQRIKGLSLTAVVSNALLGTNHIKTLVKEFHYPTQGPGMMWAKFQAAVESHGGQVQLNSEVSRIRLHGHHIRGLVVQRGDKTTEIGGDAFISSMPLGEMIPRLDPPPPAKVVQIARSLNYRALILVGLIVDRADIFPDNWLYIHSPEVKVGRIQNFKNWSPAMVPDPAKTSLGMEYFCTAGDALWRMSDAELVQLATRELSTLGLAALEDVEDGVVFRHAHAYPVYDPDYRARLGVIQGFLATIDNLQTIGRNGMHRYNNQDHSMLTGMLAVENMLGNSYDLWGVNEEEEYLEEAR
jgi:protoporphyrinogen oxidase